MLTGWCELRSKFIFGWTISTLQALSSLALLASSAWLISRADQRPSIMYLSIAVVGVRAFALGKAFFRYSERLVLHDATFRKATKRRTEIFSSLVNRAPIGLADTKLGALLTNLVDDAEESLNEDLRYRPALVQSIAVTLAGVIIFFWLAPQFALQAVLVLVLGAGVTYLGSRFTAGLALKQLNDLRAELATISEIIVSRNRVLLSYGWEQQSFRQAEVLSKRISQAERKLAGSTGLIQSFISLSTYIAVLASAQISINAGTLLPSEQVAVLALLPLSIFEYLQTLPSALQAREKAKISIDRLRQLQSTPTPTELQVEGEIQLEGFSRLSTKGVVAKYPNGTEVSIPDMELRGGECVSVVGASGSGKSTLANLLVGFLGHSRGEFLLNGISIKNYSGTSLRQTVGLVEQQPVILAGTVRDNLHLASPQSNDLDLIDALKSVDLWEMLSNRQGLETEVGQLGSKLSGGESQRLALARNLLANRKLIILDEPTSSLDSVQSIELLNTFIQLAGKQRFTLLLITHDLSLAKLTDRLVKF